MANYWSLGMSIGFCAAIGIVLGTLFSNLHLWLVIGAGVGAVLGAVTEMYKKKNHSI